MATAPITMEDTNITFFSTCPTGWDSISQTQKDSCIGSRLARQIGSYFAWAAAGELLAQWIQSGREEYRAVIEHGSNRRSRGSRKRKIPTHELRLLSLSPDKDSAVPFVIITSMDKDDKVARETILRLEQHPRLSRFGLKYITRLGNLKLTMEKSIQIPASQFEGEHVRMSGLLDGDADVEGLDKGNATVTQDHTPSLCGSFTKDLVANAPLDVIDGLGTRACSETLCGARIAVYTHSGNFRGQRKNVSTIGSVLRIKGRYYALTVAHVFFDDIDSTTSWADSGLYISSDSSTSLHQEASIPRSSNIYEVVIESLWPHKKDLQDGSDISPAAIGLVSPSLPHGRGGPAITGLAEVIWNAEMDWALVELRNPALWKPNTLVSSAGRDVILTPPLTDLPSQVGEVLIASGVSGEVKGMSLGAVSSILLPWSTFEITTWSVESEIAVGDSGSLALEPRTGMIHGIVVAHDSETLMTYVIPILPVLKSILRHFELSLTSISTMFSVSTVNPVLNADTVWDTLGRRDELDVNINVQSQRTVYELFLSKLRTSTMRNVDGQQYIRKSSLIGWLLSESSISNTHIDNLLDFAYSEYIIVPVEARHISNPAKASLLVFSLLLELGHGDLIHHFMRFGLIDSKLPFPLSSLEQALTADNVSQNTGLACQFFERQWAYCPLIFDLEMRLELPPQTVIPMHSKSRVNAKGGIASVWRITILEEFVGEDLRAAIASAKINDTSDDSSPCYQFAIKTFRSTQHEFFKAERDAFHALKGDQYLIRCLGDYTCAQQDQISYNLFLEYGELDLDEYFNTTVPPMLPSEIIALWKGLLNVAKAIHGLHSFKVARAGVVQNFLGWHADIKPDNILIVNGEFKLADPGFVSFMKVGEEPSLPRGGTISYGAPECAQAQIRPTKISQAIDIWSFGCVLSVVATWIVLGQPGVHQFSLVRERAIKELKYKFTTGQCFHDGTHVLKDVHEWHRHLRVLLRPTNLITGEILDFIDDCMLVQPPERRINASTMCDRLESILAQTKRHFNIPSQPTEAYRMDTTKCVSGSDYASITHDAKLQKPCVIGQPTAGIRDQPLGPVWHVPFHRKLFVGRQCELQHLRDKVFQSDSRRNVALMGLGGVGKSQLALELAYQIKSEHPQCSIFWIQATNQLTFERDMLAIGKKLQIPGIENDKTDTRLLVKQYLSEPSTGRWLFILDEADDVAIWGQRSRSTDEFALVDFLPRTVNGSILITTRSRSVAHDLSGKDVIQVHSMSEIEAVQIFTNTLVQPDEASDRRATAALMKRLTYFPLAIVQAASFINKTQVPVRTYLELLDEREEDVIKLLGEDFGDPSRYANASNPIATTWLISFEHIRKHSPTATMYLAFMACLNEKNIPLSVLPEAGSKFDVVRSIAVLGHPYYSPNLAPSCSRKVE